jgi:hypothetical protein
MFCVNSCLYFHFNLKTSKNCVLVVFRFFETVLLSFNHRLR